MVIWISIGYVLFSDGVNGDCLTKTEYNEKCVAVFLPWAQGNDANNLCT